MRSISLLAGTILLTASAALAGPGHMQHAAKAPAAKKAAPATVHCAVETGNAVNIKAATASKMFADYKGNRYFFCCGDCKPAFKKNPAKYAKNDHIKTPAAPAKK